MLQLAIFVVSACVVAWAACVVLELAGGVVGACLDAWAEAWRGDGKPLREEEMGELTPDERLHWRNRAGL